MKLLLIVDVALIALTVSVMRSVSLSYRECEGPWFGPFCRYKCRCGTGKCANGSCIGTDTCNTGWFGPQCQFIDLAYKIGNIPKLTDNNSSTCINDSSIKNISIIFKEPFIFTWIRMVFASSWRHNVTVYFKPDDNLSGCDKETTHFYDQTLDIFCYISKMIDRLFVSGQVSDMCSLLVSGGRNIALRQATWQSSTYWEMSNDTHKNITYPSENAIDGIIEPNIEEWATCSSTAQTNTTSQSWKVTLARAAVVDRYVVFLISDVPDDGWKLTLQAVSSERHPVFTFIATEPKSSITIVNRTLDVSSVIITSEKGGLELCEVEIYGDTQCTDGHFGRDCEHKCNCLKNSSCIASTGFCPQGCAPGFRGLSCTLICEAESYGQDCQGKCSGNCVAVSHENTSCDHVTGHCLKKCKLGYRPPLCQLLCPVGTFGQDCLFPCRSTCNIPLKNNSSYCNASSGKCLFGCLSGYTGDNCSTICKAESYGHNCEGNCSKNCVAMGDGPNSCDYVTGYCLKGCEVGYQPPWCQLLCPLGTFGQDCEFPCSSFCDKTSPDNNSSYCNSVSGACAFGCESGYSGDDCRETCDPGTYGMDCTLHCSSACVIPDHDKESYCHHINGSCLYGCSNGYFGSECFTPCLVGYYGKDCGLRCSVGCLAPVSRGDIYCDNVNGSCARGCILGYEGETCNAMSSVLMKPVRVSRSLIVGSVCGVVFVLGTAMVLLLKRRPMYTSQEV